jgi:glycosyltransferase involved in cell wall biosynthesis
MRLAQWEREVLNRVHTTIYISPIDARAASDGTPRGHIEIIPNGVYTQDAPELASRTTVGDRTEIVLGFIGHMGYPPNSLAATRLAGIFERLSRTDPRYRLLIIGREPAPEILQLRSDKITVTGTVDNIWEYMEKVDFFVFPMLSGAGQQNKVLEAMYSRKTVFCNATANGGIGAVSGEHLELCESDDDFVDSIARLAQDPQRSEAMALAGRAFVMENYSWSTTLPRYEAVLRSVFTR